MQRTLAGMLRTPVFLDCTSHRTSCEPTPKLIRMIFNQVFALRRAVTERRSISPAGQRPRLASSGTIAHDDSEMPAMVTTNRWLENSDAVPGCKEASTAKSKSEPPVLTL